MAIVSVSEVKPGDYLVEDVKTPFGNVLFHRGKLITARDVAILQAFLVPAVAVQKERDLHAYESKHMRFLRDYDAMIQLIKSVFHEAAAGMLGSMNDLQASLERLLAGVAHDTVLDCPPPRASLENQLYETSLRVALTSYLLARWHGFQKRDWLPIAWGGLLHDIGHMQLNVPLDASPERQCEEQRKHTLYGYALLKKHPAISEGVTLCALQHHEREDGSGYPLALQGEKIHPYAQVVAVAALYHQLADEEMARTGHPSFQVLEQLQQQTFGKLNHTVVLTLVSRITGAMKQGSLVILNDGRAAEVIKTDRNHPTRPVVCADGRLVALAAEPQLHISYVRNVPQ